MIFLAQINLVEIRNIDVEDLLPDGGMIYFFIYFEDPESNRGAEYSFLFDRDACEVIYSQNQNIIKAEFPDNLTPEYHFKSSRIEFLPLITFPSNETLDTQSLPEEDRENACAFYDTFGDHGKERILGHATPIQDDVTIDWALSYLNLKDFAASGQNEARIEAIRPELVNLLQFTLANPITGFDKIGISDGYFGITKADLRDRNFENAVLIFQYT